MARAIMLNGGGINLPTGINTTTFYISEDTNTIDVDGNFPDDCDLVFFSNMQTSQQTSRYVKNGVITIRNGSGAFGSITRFLVSTGDGGMDYYTGISSGVDITISNGVLHLSLGKTMKAGTSIVFLWSED